VSFAGFLFLWAGSLSWHSLRSLVHLSQICWPASLTHLAFAFAQVMQLRVEADVGVPVWFVPATSGIGR
jgi:hypothetical protein